MAKHRTYSIEFKRQVAQEFLAGESLHGLSRRHDVSRNLIRVWVAKLEAGTYDEDAEAADLCRNTRRKSLPSSAWSAGRRTRRPCAGRSWLGGCLRG